MINTVNDNIGNCVYYLNSVDYRIIFPLNVFHFSVQFQRAGLSGFGCFLSVLFFSDCPVFVPQVRRGAIGAQCGLVFAYNGASEKFHAEEHFKRFESYDKWKLKEFKQFLKTRYKWTFCNVYVENKFYIWFLCNAARIAENCAK